MVNLIYNYFLKIDYYLFHSLNQFAFKSAILDGAAVFFAEWSGYLIIAAFLFFLWRKRIGIWRKFKILLAVIFTAVISRFGIVVLIRALHFRARPFLSLPVRQLLNYNGAEASFPSGHAAFFFAFSAAVYYYNKKLGIAFFVVSVLMGLARIFSGIHYPADVAAGSIVGIFSGWLVTRFKFFR